MQLDNFMELEADEQEVSIYIIVGHSVQDPEHVACRKRTRRHQIAGTLFQRCKVFQELH